MSLNIGDNFKYLGKKFLDERESFNTLEEMNACNDVPEGFITYCKENQKRYEYKNGAWKVYTVSGGTGGAGMTDEQLETLNSKFDDVAVEQQNETNTLTFYANGNPVKSVNITSVILEAGTLTTSFAEYSVIAEKDTVIIPYNFQTENRGEAKLYVGIVVGEASKDLEYTISKIGAGSINLGQLTKGINYISMYVIDSAGKQTNVVDLTIVCGALDITSTFDDGKDYETYNSITIPFTVSALDPNDTMVLKRW